MFGDFNTNYFNDTQCQPLMSLVESFYCIKIVTEPTLISSGSLLDHVYITPSSIQIISNSIESVYTDHDAVVTTLQYFN